MRRQLGDSGDNGEISAFEKCDPLDWWTITDCLHRNQERLIKHQNKKPCRIDYYWYDGDC